MPPCVNCQRTNVGTPDAQCAACSKSAVKNTFLENTVKQYLNQHADLALYTHADKALPCAPTRRRPDFYYVLEDRVVVLEVDESEHRYNTTECETRREYELLYAIPPEKRLVIVRFNPNPSRSDMFQAFERLGTKLRQSFVTDDVKYTDDGILRIFINYTSARKRKLASAVAEDQRKALKSGFVAEGQVDEVEQDAEDAPASAEGGCTEEDFFRDLELYAYHQKQARNFWRRVHVHKRYLNQKQMTYLQKITDKPQSATSDFAEWRNNAMTKAIDSVANTVVKEVDDVFETFLSNVRSILHTEDDIKACLQDPHGLPDKNGYKIIQPAARKLGVFAHKVGFIHKRLTEFDGGALQHINISRLSNSLREMGLKRAQIYFPEDKKAAAVFFGFKTSTWDLPDTLKPQVPQEPPTGS